MGLMGFSLGAAVLAAFLSKLAHGDEFVPGDSISLQDVEFVAFFSGFVPRDPDLGECIRSEESRTYFARNIPSYHCFGLQDGVVTPEKSAELATLFRGEEISVVGAMDELGGIGIVPREAEYVFAHEGGHFVPSKAKSGFTSFVRQFASPTYTDETLQAGPCDTPLRR